MKWRSGFGFFFRNSYVAGFYQSTMREYGCESVGLLCAVRRAEAATDTQTLGAAGPLHDYRLGNRWAGAHLAMLEWTGQYSVSVLPITPQKSSYRPVLLQIEFLLQLCPRLPSIWLPAVSQPLSARPVLARYPHGKATGLTPLWIHSDPRTKTITNQ